MHTCEISLNTKLINVLKENYGFNSKFRQCDEFLNELKIVTSHYAYPEWVIQAQHIHFRIQTPRLISYVDKNLKSC